MAKAVTGKKLKKTIQKTDKAQSERFKQAARELGTDENGSAFEEAFGKMVPPKTVKRS